MTDAGVISAIRSVDGFVELGIIYLLRTHIARSARWFLALHISKLKRTLADA